MGIEEPLRAMSESVGCQSTMYEVDDKDEVIEVRHIQPGLGSCQPCRLTAAMVGRELSHRCYVRRVMFY